MKLIITLMTLFFGVNMVEASENTVVPIVSKEHHAWFTAIEEDDTDTIVEMIGNGFDINTVGKHPESGYYQYTALMLAASLGNQNKVNQMLKYGADINIQTLNGDALVSAAKNSQLDILTLLLVSGSSIDKKNIDGQTALMVASSNGHFDIVAMLIIYGSDVSVADIRGNTAFDYAKMNNHEDVIKLFEYYNKTVEDINAFLKYIAEQIAKSQSDNKTDDNKNETIDN